MALRDVGSGHRGVGLGISKVFSSLNGSVIIELGIKTKKEKCLANSGDYVEKQCFVAENLLYQILLLSSFYLLWFPWK